MRDLDNLRRMERELADQQKLVEAGWQAYRRTALPEEASAPELEEFRSAFFGGAFHLFCSVLNILTEQNGPPSDADIVRMGQISEELDQFNQMFGLKFYPAEGRPQ
jgi:hypothetical protein